MPEINNQLPPLCALQLNQLPGMIKIIFILIVMLAIVALIVSAANDYMEGKIRIEFDDEERNE